MRALKRRAKRNLHRVRRDQWAYVWGWERVGGWRLVARVPRRAVNAASAGIFDAITSGAAAMRRGAA